MARPLRSVRIARRMASVAAATALGLFATTAASSAPSPPPPDSIVDNETVYVIADATGAPRTTVVVDWLQVEGAGMVRIVDPAPGAGATESLTDGFAPERSGDDLVADVTVDGTDDFFYRAETEQELPLDVRLAYFLDGEPVEAEDLAGKSGRLRMELTLVNRLERTEVVTYETAGGGTESAEVTYTVPMLCIPQFEIDGTRMTAIEAPESAQLAITGSTLTYAVPMVPSPEVTVTLEMDARDVDLAPLIISAFPKLPASPDFSVTDDLDELRGALSDLRTLTEGHLQLVDGVTSGIAGTDFGGVTGAADGIAELTAGLGELSDGAEGLAALTGGQYAYLDGVIQGIDTSQFDSLGELTAAVTELRMAVAQLETGVLGLADLTAGQLALAEAIRSSNATLLASAIALPASVPATCAADPAAAPLLAGLDGLAQGLTAQDAMLAALIDGGDLGSGYMPGLRYTHDTLVTLGSGLTGVRMGLEELEIGSAALAAVPDAFVAIRDALVVLRDGGVVAGQALPGLGTSADGLTDLAGGLAQAEDGLAGSADSLARLAELPALMGDLTDTLTALARGGRVGGQHLPGLTTTADALGEMSGGLRDGVDDLRKGEALTRAMSEAADGYTTFLGMPEGARGHLSFLFKLDGVTRPDAE